VVQGTGEVLAASAPSEAREGQSIGLGPGQLYRLHNPGSTILKLIEVLLGPDIRGDDGTPEETT
jgi:mannose-6-phosphate isomerase-like protein (cupin superfamily)